VEHARDSNHRPVTAATSPLAAAHRALRRRPTSRILVIDDNRDNRTLLAYLIARHGHQAMLADGGREGIRLATADPPDLILLDLQMPDMDGYETLETLRTNPALATVPIVAVSAYAMAGSSGRALTSGFDGYVSKPISPETFGARLEAFLSIGRSP
jgi:CheY-like chemotaxis protein